MIKFNFLRENRDAAGNLKESIRLFSDQSQSQIQLIRIEDFQPKDFQGIEKSFLPWIQMFDCGYRVANTSASNPDADKYMQQWNGCVYVDFDSKKYHGEYEKQFNLNFRTIAREITYNLKVHRPDNFYFSQVSASGNSIHFVFYFDVEKSLINFKKCVHAATEMLVDEIMGGTVISKEAAYDIVTYPEVLDDCSSRPAQPMYLTSNVIDINDVYPTGKFDISQLVYEEEVFEPLDMDFVKVEGKEYSFLRWTDDYIKEWNHTDRFAVAKVLANFFLDDVDTAKRLYFSLCSYIHQRYPSHSEKELMRLFSNQYPNIVANVKAELARNIRNGQYTSMSRNALKFCRVVFGIEWKATNKFIPAQVENSVYDRTFTLNPGEYLSKVFTEIVSIDANVIHIEAGCGLGKTRALIEYVKEFPSKRVCFITPMTSINKNNFTETEGWLIVDSLHKKAYKNIDDGSRKSVCTTWDSFVVHDISSKDFDLFVFDEAHALFLYDYRAAVTADVVSIVRDISRHGKKVILMTGTPSIERNIIDNIYKVKVDKKLFTNKCEIVMYNQSYKGWLFNDLRMWLRADSKNMAVVMYDYVNDKMAESFRIRGFNVDTVYNKRCADDVDALDESKTLSGRITLISVYGQAGINIYAPKDHKVRLYIANECALSIIQYANRIRNRECVESVKLFYKREDMSSVIRTMEDVDLCDVRRRIDNFNRSDLKPTSWIFEHSFGLKKIYLLTGEDNRIVLNEKIYESYAKSENLIKYESQMQLLYKRMTDAFYDVDFKYLSEDPKDVYDTRMKDNVASVIETGRILDCIEFRDGRYVLDTEKDKVCRRYMDDNTEKALQNVIDFLVSEFDTFSLEKRMEWSSDALKYIREKYTKFVDVMSKKNKSYSVSKSDVKAWSRMCDLRRKLAAGNIGDEEIGCVLNESMKNGELDIKCIIRFAAARAALYSPDYDERTFRNMADDIFTQMKQLAKNVSDFDWFINLDVLEMKKTGRESDPEVINRTASLEQYLTGKYYKPKKQRKVFAYSAGDVLQMEFDSKEKVAERFGVSVSTVKRWLKSGALQNVEQGKFWYFKVVLV